MSDFYVHVIPIGARPSTLSLSPDSGVYFLRASNEWTFDRHLCLHPWRVDVRRTEDAWTRRTVAVVLALPQLPVIFRYSEVKWTHDNLLGSFH